MSTVQSSSTEALRGESLPLPLYFGFVLTGIVTVLLGPLLPFLSTQWALDDAQAGYFFAAQFLGSMFGVGLTSWLLPRHGFRILLLSSYGLMAVGIATLAVVPWKAGLVAVLVYGIALGLAIPTSNLWTGAANPHRRAAALSFLNAAWGVGAVACAPLLALARRTMHSGNFLFVLAGALVLTAVGFIANAPPSEMTAPLRDDRVPESNSPANFRALMILGTLFFLYVGTESSLGGWVALYSRRVGGAGDSIATLIPSVFWAMLILGRGASSGLLRRSNELQLVRISLPVACVGVIVLIAAQGPRGIVSGIGLAGLGLAVVYPITIANLSRMGERAMRRSGPMFALAGLGGATLPGLVGFLSARYGSLRIGLAIPLCSALVMTGLYLSASRWQVNER